MEGLIDTLTRGNATEVKVLLASVALALAVYQLVLIAVGYGKLRPPFLGAGPAARTLVALDGPLSPRPGYVGVAPAGPDLAHVRGRRPGADLMEARPHTAQMFGSLLVALAIVAVAIAVVTSRFGSTSAAEREA